MAVHRQHVWIYCQTLGGEFPCEISTPRCADSFFSKKKKHANPDSGSGTFFSHPALLPPSTIPQHANPQPLSRPSPSPPLQHWHARLRNLCVTTQEITKLRTAIIFSLDFHALPKEYFDLSNL